MKFEIIISLYLAVIGGVAQCGLKNQHSYIFILHVRGTKMTAEVLRRGEWVL